jgi:hypothetical protein
VVAIAANLPVVGETYAICVACTIMEFVEVKLEFVLG